MNVLLTPTGTEGICAPSLRCTIVNFRSGLTCPRLADVAQLVAHHLAKVRVAGSNPVIRSKGANRHQTPTVEWPSGEATACKAVHTGSIPVSTSKPARLAQRESASLTRKRSLVQSQYRAPQSFRVKRRFIRRNPAAGTRHELVQRTALAPFNQLASPRGPLSTTHPPDAI